MRIAAGTRLYAERLTPAPDLLDLAACGRLRRPQVLTVRGWQVLVGDPVAEVRDLASLDRWADRLGWRQPPTDGPPFTGGLAGFVSDDVTPALLDLPPRPWEGGAFHPDTRPETAALPPLWFGVYDAAVCVDPEGEAWLTAATREAADRLRPAMDRAAPPSQPVSPGTAGVARPSLDRHAHAAAVEQVLGWIAAGDLYQLNLTLQLSVPWAAGGALLARRLWAANPAAAHAAYVQAPGGVEVASVSPETFLAADGDRVRIRPIKGTRPRSDAPASDAAEAAALLGSAKDRAEHTMIVDLERNDLGVVCEPGSVRVSELAALEAHPTVWHLTSTVEGSLLGDVSLSGLLRATFPSGSVTGAPKRMAVCRTAALEPVRRGVYCGAIGVVSRGLVDLSVAIRTAVVDGAVASYGAGGAIVAESTPEAEWDEALAKASAFLTAAGAAPPR